MQSWVKCERTKISWSQSQQKEEKEAPLEIICKGEDVQGGEQAYNKLREGSIEIVIPMAKALK